MSQDLHGTATLPANPLATDQPPYSITITPGSSLADIATRLQLPATNPPDAGRTTLLLLGNTELPDSVQQTRLQQLLGRGLAQAVGIHHTLVIDGSLGDQATMLLSDDLLDRNNGTLILKVIEGDIGPGLQLESENIRYILVKDVKDVKDGSGNGSIAHHEVNAIYAIAGILAADDPVLTLLINDSPTAKESIVRSVRRGWPVLIIWGSGGLADTIHQEWLNRLAYLQSLATWKPEPGQAQQSPPPPSLIADAQVAEIIAEGDLYFFSITDTAEKLASCIDLRLEASTLLDRVQVQQNIYSKAASRQEHIFQFQQNFILGLGVFITALAAFQTFYKGMQWNVLLTFAGPKIVLGDVFYYALIALPVVLAILIAGANRFNPGEKWLMLRAASQAFKRERFRYQTRTSIYSDAQVAHNNTTREATLAKMLETITSQWIEGNLEFTLFPSSIASTNGPNLPNSTSSPQGKTRPKFPLYLSPTRYITERLDDQIQFYRRKCVKLGGKLRWLQWVVLILGGVATLLAALRLEWTITITTAIATALTTYLEYNQVSNSLKQYNHAILSLTQIHNWWSALGEGQADPLNIDKLVSYVETTLQSEQAGWVQQMQTALTDLRAQQATHGQNAATTEPINTPHPPQEQPDSGMSPTDATPSPTPEEVGKAG